MSDYYIFEGPDLDELISKSLQKLGLKEEQAEIEIIQEGQAGVLGFGKKNFKIKLVPLVKISLKKDEKNKENIDSLVNSNEKTSTGVKLSVEKSKDGIFIIANTEEKGGLEDVQKVLEENSIVNVDYDAVKNFLEGNKSKMKIAEFDADIYRNSEIFVELAPDRQEAFVTVTEPQGGNSATFDEVIEKLSENGVVFGLMEKEINEIIFDKKYNEKKVVAQAKKPLQGENAKLHYKVSLSKDVKPQMMEDGRVDFKSLNIITNVVKGEVLAELIPETAGTPGTNILGEEIPATPGSPVKIESFVGKNVEISEEGNKIISQIDGQIVVEGERLSVVAIYTVEGDVDLNVGNIDFIGSVFVKGNVLDGFHIKAKGNIEIEKSVGASNIEATGDIVIKGGIMGKDAGLIKAGGNIFVKFIENGKIITDKEVMVGKAIMHSNVRASKIHVSDGKGLIVGGIIKAQEEIDCKILGSHLATKTSVIIGIKEEIMRRIEEIDAEVTKIYDDMDKVNEAIDLLKNLKKRLGNLPEDKEEKLQKYQMLISSLEKKSESLMEERDRHEEEIEGSQGGKLKVKEVIYPGVTVTIRKGVMHIKDEVKFASIVYEDGYLKINPYS